MIVRILGEGRFDVPDDAMPDIDNLYNEMVTTARNVDQDAYEIVLADLLSEVRLQGSHIGMDRLGSFDTVLPAKDATVGEARVLLELLAQIRAGVFVG